MKFKEYKNEVKELDKLDLSDYEGKFISDIIDGEKWGHSMTCKQAQFMEKLLEKYDI